MHVKKLLTTILLRVVFFISLIGNIQTVQAAAVSVTNFTQIPNAKFIDIPETYKLDPVAYKSLSIIADRSFATGAFSKFLLGKPNPAIPSHGDGYWANENGTGGNFDVKAITLNFSLPLEAFGVTFIHMPEEYVGGNKYPAFLQVFDGPNGSGNLIGSITSSGLLTQSPVSTPSFVAILSDKICIQSAILTGTGPTHGFAVDGYAVYDGILPVSNVPIPASIWLFVSGLIGILGFRFSTDRI